MQLGYQEYQKRPYLYFKLYKSNVQSFYSLNHSIFLERIVKIIQSLSLTFYTHFLSVNIQNN